MCRVTASGGWLVAGQFSKAQFPASNPQRRWDSRQFEPGDFLLTLGDLAAVL